jgi:biotin transport system substrate-specific component
MVDRYIKSRKFLSMLAIMFFATFVLIYIPGLIQFYLWTGSSIGISELLMMCVLPFLAADIIKAVIVATIATSITPKGAYGREVDIV